MEVSDLRKLRQMSRTKRFPTHLRGIMPKKRVFLFDSTLMRQIGLCGNLLWRLDRGNGDDGGDLFEKLFECGWGCALNNKISFGERCGKVHQLAFRTPSRHASVGKMSRGGGRRGCRAGCRTERRP